MPKKKDPFEDLTEEEAASVEAIEGIAIGLADVLVLVVRAGVEKERSRSKDLEAKLETVVVKLADDILKFALTDD